MQQREHGRVLAFGVGQRRAAAFQNGERPAHIDRVAKDVRDVQERRVDRVRQTLRRPAAGIGQQDGPGALEGFIVPSSWACWGLS
ncbi:hypothetical protein [Paraburkholderia flagellata]|uniref:hypothetical protein n=1 Tax=Paraburkholderia flagellata TaxID=2883241 RepID=UPI001F1BCAD5|nr:hypothetical protein [Paraburkholderia flagellata]